MVPWSALWGQRSPLASPGASTRPYAPTGDRLAAPSAISGRIDSRARQLDSASTDELRITQIAEALVGERPPSEIVNAINEQRPFFDIAELDELLDRTKELQAEVQKTPLRKPVKRKGPSQTVIRGSSQSNRDRGRIGRSMAPPPG